VIYLANRIQKILDREDVPTDEVTSDALALLRVIKRDIEADYKEGERDKLACPFCGYYECVTGETDPREPEASYQMVWDCYAVVCEQCDMAGPVAENEAEAVERFKRRDRAQDYDQAHAEAVMEDRDPFDNGRWALDEQLREARKLK